MLIAVGFILIGFVLLMGGAEFLVRGSVALAGKLRIPPIIVGLTIVALGTSTPEFVVSVKAALSGSAGISVGNIVGSNIANVFLILGIASIIYPIKTRRRIFLRDFKFLLLVSVVFVIFALSGTFVRWHGVVFIAMLVGFIYYNYINAKKSDFVGDLDNSMANRGWFFVIGITLIALITIVYGADLLVKGAVDIARIMNISEDIIGLTIVAVGTSLPELATTVMAAIRKQNDVALGNVVGSNIWNILFIMGFTATIEDVNVSLQFRYFDIWIVLLSTLLLLPTIMTKAKISRSEGVLFLLVYVFYIASQVLISKGYWTFG